MTALELMARADAKPGRAHRDVVERTQHQSVAKKYGRDDCCKCGGLYETWALQWLSRSQRICMRCRMEAEKLAINTKGTQ